MLIEWREKIIESSSPAGGLKTRALREGLRLLEQREAENEAKLAALRAAAQAGLDALDEGRFDEVREEDVEWYIAELGRQAAKTAAKAAG